MIYAASFQQSLGIAIAVLSVIGWMLYSIFITASGKDEAGSEIELAPNRKPYLDDEQLETRKLDQTLAMGLGALLIVGIGLPLYWVAEPGRQENALINFDQTFASRGETTYLEERVTGSPSSFGCAACHGLGGVGGVTSFAFNDPVTGEPRSVQWEAPALDTVLLRYSEEEVTEVIVHGRPGTPMPAWGVEGGGPMNTQQVRDIVEYLKSITKDPDEVQAESAAAARAAVERGDYESLGEALFALNCARCHTQGYSYGEAGVSGGGYFGPSLTDGATVRKFPDIEDMISFIGKGSNANERYGVGGIGSGRMPGFEQMLTPEDLRAIVEYERGL